MGSKAAITVLWLLLLGLTDAVVEVNMTGAWKPRVGWDIRCVWTLGRAPLQSVRLYLDELQFLVLRPEKDGRNFSGTFEPVTRGTRLRVNCYDQGLRGSCNVEVQLLSAPIFDSVYKCEVSEEAPRFDMSEALYLQKVLVPLSYPQLEVRNVNGTTEVNCTTDGIPAPRLRWRVGDMMIEENFSGRRWDFDTKLWHSWSVVSALRPSELPLTCIATATRPARHPEEQSTGVYLNSASYFSGAMFLLQIMTVVALLR